MSEATPIRQEDKEDHSVEISTMLSEIAAIGDLLLFYTTDEAYDGNTVSAVGNIVHRHATRIDQLLYGGEK